MGDLLQTEVQVVFKTITWILICCSHHPGKKWLQRMIDLKGETPSFLVGGVVHACRTLRSILLNVFSTQSKFGTPNATFWIILGWPTPLVLCKPLFDILNAPVTTILGALRVHAEPPIFTTTSASGTHQAKLKESMLDGWFDGLKPPPCCRVILVTTALACTHLNNQRHVDSI